MVTLVAGAGAAAAGGQPSAEDMEIVARGTPYGYGKFPFTVTAKSARGIYPGVTKDLQLTLSNPYDFAISVQSLTGYVTGASRGRCRPHPSNLVTKPYRGTLPVIVRARAKTTVGAIPLFMPTTASQTCADTTFTIHLSGSATKASR